MVAERPGVEKLAKRPFLGGLPQIWPILFMVKSTWVFTPDMVIEAQNPYYHIKKLI